MKQSKRCIVITTINPAGESLARFAVLENYDLILVGDKKSPKSYDLKAVYLDLDEQQKLFPKFARLTPLNHYCRKNLGYLYAIKQGYGVIGESDDDNVPYENWGDFPQKNNYPTIVSPKFPNVYREFTDNNIWPRGYPLDQVLSRAETKINQLPADVLIWQGLADGDTDVDAIYRLTINQKVNFKKDKAVVLSEQVISPFNSQNTLWQKRAQVFLYLPQTVTFRYTDILRSLIAQFGIWALGGRLGFMSPTVSADDRNPHDILKDFADEVPMYNSFYKVVETLQGCRLSGQPEDLPVMYRALAAKGVVGDLELESVEEWLKVIS